MSKDKIKSNTTQILTLLNGGTLPINYNRITNLNMFCIDEFNSSFCIDNVGLLFAELWQNDVKNECDVNDIVSDTAGSGASPSSNTGTKKPLHPVEVPKTGQKQIIGIDYLQLFCRKIVNKKSKRFTFELLGSTKNYKSRYLVYDNKENIEVCDYMCDPNLRTGKDSVSIKFKNEILYYDFFNARYLERFLEAIGVKLHSISRLDIYKDIQKFKGNYRPERLIEDYFAKKLIRKGRGKFCVWGDSAEKDLQFQYLCFGMKQSGQQVYMYNKNLEMKQKKEKEYIRQTWDNIGFNPDMDVWRVEMSVQRVEKRFEFDNIDIVDKKTGEIKEKRKLTINDIFKKDIQELIFTGMENRCFEFRYRKKGVRTARSKRKELFVTRTQQVKLKKRAKNIDKLRTKKLVLKHLMTNLFNNKYQREHKTRGVSSELYTIYNHINNYNLKGYAVKILNDVIENKKYTDNVDILEAMYEVLARSTDAGFIFDDERYDTTPIIDEIKRAKRKKILEHDLYDDELLNIGAVPNF